PPAAAPAAYAGSDAAPTETVVRPRGPVAPPAAAAPQLPAGPTPGRQPDTASAPRSRRGLAVGIVGGGASAVVAGAVIVSVVLFGGDAADPTPDETPKPAQTAAVPQRIAPPVLAADPALDGTTVVFELENPDPDEGDTLIWKL